jgi:hypothetical protein
VLLGLLLLQALLMDDVLDTGGYKKGAAPPQFKVAEGSFVLALPSGAWWMLFADVQSSVSMLLCRSGLTANMPKMAHVLVLPSGARWRLAKRVAALKVQQEGHSGLVSRMPEPAVSELAGRCRANLGFLSRCSSLMPKLELAVCCIFYNDT